MRRSPSSAHASRGFAISIRRRIEREGEKVWRLQDFGNAPLTAVAQALSRFTRQGMIERLSKGVYYRARETTFGKSRPNPATIQKLVSLNKPVFPSGIAAANLLGFSTQTAKQGEVATCALSLPRKLMGPDTVIHTRRPEAWAHLSCTDGALLDFLRKGGKTSEMPPADTIHRAMVLLSEEGRLQRLLKVADSEPPRVRAILGAMGQQLGLPPARLNRLRDSLNSLSRFDFGLFGALTHARTWQAKERRAPEVI